MAKFAPVAPIQVLEQMYADSPKTFGEYHLLLAHHTVAHENRFARLFQRIAADGVIRPLVIMDNSVVECGGYVNFEMMQTACHAVSDQGIDVVPVLPDVMGKGQETREAVLEAYDKWTRQIPGVGFMAVCQGENFQDYEGSLRTFANRARFPLIEFLGVPRFLVGILGSRRHATSSALRERDDHRVHLLGYSDIMWDDVGCSRIPGVDGIDSAVPLRISEPFSPNLAVGPRPPSWFEEAEFDALMKQNLQAAREIHL